MLMRYIQHILWLYSYQEDRNCSFQQLGYLFYKMRATLRYKRVYLLLIMLLLSAPDHICAQPADHYVARQGILNLKDVDFTRQTVDLKGQWKWYWHQLRQPNDPESKFEYTRFPHLWSAGTWQQAALPSQGYATYALTVLLPAHSGPLALEMPDQYCAYRLYVNGKELAHDGTPATTPAAIRSHWSTQLVRLPAGVDTLRLLLQIANFDHAKGGSAKAIQLGDAERLEASLAVDGALDLFLAGCLFMSGLFFLGLFGFSRTDRPMLYFGLFCLVYTYRIIGTDHYVLHSLLPNLPWALSIRLEYSSLYLSIALFVIYTKSLYPQDTHTYFTTGMAWICLAFAGSVLVLPPVLFTQLMNPFLGLMVVYIGYAFYVYWRAARRGRPGARYSLMSTALLLAVFSLILGQYLSMTPPSTVLPFIGYLGFFFLQSLVLSFRFAFALNEARLTEKQFLANMSHEIRTPLNAILGFSNLLETTTLNGEQKEFVSYIRTAGKNLLTIVNDILDIAKIEAGMVPLEIIPFSIDSLVDSIRAMLQGTADEKHLQLIVETDATLPALVMGDPTRLTQILLNLLSNAIKFTREGSVTIRIENRQEVGGLVQVRFTVEDTGIGIAPNVLPHIFDRFRQANDSTTRFYGGTGLGLSIVKSLTQLQGGWVKVSSTPGEGSCFTLEISYKIARKTADPLTPNSPAPWGNVVRSLNILVVEDNPMNQKLALGVLSRLGHTAQVADNGLLAIDILKTTTFDMILMDIQMPVMDGYTTTHHIRTNMQSKVPIIAMTAHALASEREHCLQAGMNDFLPKPFRPEELQQLLQKYTPNLTPPHESVPQNPVLPALQAGFSMDALLNGVDGETDLAFELLSLFLDQTPPEIQQMRRALVTNDFGTIGRIIHGQKVAIKLMGMQAVLQQLDDLETLLAAPPVASSGAALVENYLLMLDAELPAIQATLQTRQA